MNPPSKNSYTKRITALYLIIGLSILSAGCTNMFFYPMKKHVLSPEKIGLEYEDVFINTDEGYKLHGWFLPAQKVPRATIIFLHGNAENISTHIGAIYWLPEQGFNVFIYDYRGYGKSEGEVDIDGTIADVTLVIDHISNRDDIKGSNLIIYGQSLGGAIASNAVANYQAKNNIKALVLESSFSDFRKIAREKLGEGWLTWAFQWPLSLTITSDYSPQKALRNISDIPILIIHGDDDEIIPHKHGKTLYDAASEPKELWIVPEGKHIAATINKEYRIKLVDYFEKVTTN